MSHVEVAKTFITDLESFAESCAVRGMEFMPNQTKHVWYGRWMDDWHDPARAAAMQGFDPATFGKCLHAVRIADPALRRQLGRKAYEIGLVPRPDGGEGYALVFDKWGSGGRNIENLAGVGLKELCADYSERSKVKALRKRGYRVEIEQISAGKKKLIVRPPRP